MRLVAVTSLIVFVWEEWTAAPNPAVPAEGVARRGGNRYHRRQIYR